MRISTSWLRDYLSESCAEADLLEALMAAGLEIEQAIDLQASLGNVVVGFIRAKQPLNDADGMFLLRIEVARGEVLDIVCASEHPIEVGWGVPVAREGIELPTGSHIQSGRFHGAKSQGMVCLDGELGLVARTSGLQVFRDEAALGASLPSVSAITDTLLELSILPNRPDCLGLIGIAREVAAILGVKVRYPAQTSSHGSGQGTPSVVIDDPALCTRYTCQVFNDVRVDSSPHWLKSRLQIAGHRPINNVVDVTNFVMLEWGQPLHAFDFDSLSGGRIEVRRMRRGERFALLDETEIDDTHNPLVIADAKQPIALAGIMGGAATQTRATTRSVLLEAACFDPVCIRETSRRLGVTTDSSYRFERGTDPNDMLAGAFNRAAALLQDPEISAARPAHKAVDCYPTVRPRRVFSLDSHKLSRLFGATIHPEEIRTCLTKLEMDCDDALTVKVPTWRVDVNDVVVLAEDVARLRGYDSIETKPMQGTSTSGRLAQSDRLRSNIAEFLIGNGFLECRTTPLVSVPATTIGHQWPGDAIKLKNPITNDMTALRRSLIPSLFEVVERNARRRIESFKLFEIDRVFCAPEGKQSVREDWVVTGLMGGKFNNAAWIVSEKEIGFLHVKGIIQNLLHRIDVQDVGFEIGAVPAGYVPEETVAVTANGKQIGLLGLVDASRILSKSRTRVPLYAFEINISALQSNRAAVRRFAGIARTPSVTRDISIAVPVDVPYAQIASSLAEAFSAAAENLTVEPRSEEAAIQLRPRLESATCVDVYTDKTLGSGTKSITIRMEFGDEQHTLTSGEAQQLVDKVVDRLRSAHGATQR